MMTCSTEIEILADQILQKLPGHSAWRYRFLLKLFVLWPALLGRHNFVNLGRQGEFTNDPSPKPLPVYSINSDGHDLIHLLNRVTSVKVNSRKLKSLRSSPGGIVHFPEYQAGGQIISKKMYRSLTDIRHLL